MPPLSVIVKKLKDRGERITPVRAEMLKILLRASEPQSPRELIAALSERGQRVNKTTVYRQLEALRRQGLIEEICFADRSKRFEFTARRHHHHVVCRSCRRAEDVYLPTDLKRQEEAVKKTTGFTEVRHSLEFFGVCRQCRKKKRDRINRVRL